MFMPATAIALKIAAPSKLAASLVTAQCLPPLLLQFHVDHSDDEERQVQKTTLIELSAKLISICIQNEAIKAVDAALLANAQTEFIAAVKQTKDHNKLVNSGFTALANCVEIVTDANRICVYEAINHYLIDAKPVLNVEESDDIDIIPVLTAFANTHADEALKQIVTPLLDRNYFTQELSLGIIGDIFEALCALVHIRKFRDPILTFLFKIVFDGCDAATVIKEPHLDIRLLGLRALRHLLENDVNEQLADELNRQYNVFERILNLIHSSNLSATPETVTIEKSIDDALYEISQILRLVVRSLDVESQHTVIGKYLSTVNLTLKTDLYFTTGLLGYLEQTVDLEDHFEHLIDELTKLSLNNMDEEITKLSNHLLCSLFNKCPDDDKHRSILAKAIKLIKDEIKKHNKRAVEVLSWISKGLLVRGHSDAAELIDTVHWIASNNERTNYYLARNFFLPFVAHRTTRTSHIV